MEETNNEKQNISWMEAHPWLTINDSGDEDSVEEVIRYTLDELRLA